MSNPAPQTILSKKYALMIQKAIFIKTKLKVILKYSAIFLESVEQQKIKQNVIINQ